MSMTYLIFLLNIFLIWCVSALNAFSGIAKEAVEWNSIVADDLSEDDHGDFELSHIIALSTDYPDIPEDAPKPEERIEVIELHNILRRNYTYPFPNVSNIPMLEYNNTAEFMAGEMLKLCEYKHVFGAAENMTGITGQNIYSGHTHMVSRALYNFYHLEIGLYYFNNYSCVEPQVMFGCGHFVTMTQAQSEHVGFNRKSNCYPLEDEVHYLHTYHYYIGGVLWNKECIHYKYGPPCTRCKPGYLCATGLCVPDPKRRCEAYNLDCECKRVCHNCATPDWKNCKCTTCKLGWDWDDCSFPCQDWAVIYYKFPKYCSRFPQSRCLRRNPWFADNRCRQFCKRCSFVKPDSNPDELCCGGKICDLYHILDLDTCECKMLSPNPKDLYPSTRSVKMLSPNPNDLYPSTGSAKMLSPNPNDLYPSTGSVKMLSPNPNDLYTSTGSVKMLSPNPNDLNPSTGSVKMLSPNPNDLYPFTETVAPKILLEDIFNATSQEPNKTFKQEPRPVGTASMIGPSLKILSILPAFFLIS